MARARMWQLPLRLLLLCGLSSASFRGKEFFTVFLQNDAAGTDGDIQLLFTAYVDSTQVTVTMRGGTFADTITLQKDEIFPLRIPSHMELAGSHVSDKAILIQSTQEISVVSTNSKSYTTGATAILPTEKLGNEYYVVTPEDKNNEGFKEFVVAAGKTSATVSITAKGKVRYNGKNYPAGSTIRILLSPYHSVQLQSADDLSGTKVTSDNIVAVLSGHTCAKVNTGCDYVVEQLLPVEAWGKEYIVPPNPLQNKVDFAYVVASQDGSITSNQGNSATTTNVVAGQVLNFKINRNSHLHVSSSVPIQVVYFFTGSSGSVYQDPFLLTIPPISSYCTAYRVGSLDSFQNHVVLIVRNEDTSTTTLNQKTEKSLAWKTIPGTDFSWAMVTMSKQLQVQSAEHEEAPFGLLVFGFQAYVGYGFPGLCAKTLLSCKDLGCKDKCEVVDGQPTCVQETFSTCWATGGPHYQTFDGKAFDFMGTCAYVLAKNCDPSLTLPFFSVEVKKDHGDNPKASSIGSVTIRVYDLTIEVVRSEKGFVRVDNHRSHLPIALSDGKLHLQQKGKSVLIQTSFKLKVLYNWADRVVVKVPSALAGKACGMCGNNNGDPQDDLLTPDGNAARDVVELGRSWKVANESHSCQDDCGEDCGQCQRVQEAKYKVETSCGLLTQRQGPFERCHATIDPRVYLKNCVYDLCASDGSQAKLCQALEAYADDCQEEGVTISDWRTPARCPLTCPKNSTYSPCGTSCPTTCNAAAIPGDCAASACVETCECQEGFALDANECVPKDNCGCIFQGLLHSPGEEFWGDRTCTKRCSCHAVSKRTTCHRRQCRSGEECGVQEGLQGCHPKSYATCSAVGATHYETFDGAKFIFQGTCIYQLAALCRKNLGLVDFLVLVQNGHHENDDVLSSIALVIVKVYDKTILINQKHPGKVTIDNQLVNLPYHPSDRKISIYRGGLEAVVETDFGLTVTYDWQSQVTVTVPSTYGIALCGLCGNYNGNAGDELKMRNGRVTSNPDTFGRSWKVADVPGCVERSNVKCSSVAATQQKALKLGCGIILEEHGPLGACRAHLDATTYFQNCVHDVCLFPERKDVVCSIVARYAAACQAAGVTIGRWRRNDFCDVLCPSNSHYEVCSRGCSRTCSNLYAPAKCSGRCREGCACDDGFVLSGDECVPESKCGCVHQDFYYKAEETFYPTNKEQCRCRAGNAVNCQETSCPGDAEGKVIDGVFQCPSVTPATCTVTGDHSYMSFDGMALNISGTCSYVLTQTCTGDEVQPFAVKMEKDARQKEKVSGIHALSIEVYGLTLTLTREKRGDVMVNSIAHHLPAVLSEGRIQVQRHGMDIVLHTNFGLVVRYDLFHHVTITIQPNYQNHLCGLCGNYNGQRDDDLLLPGGQKAPNVVAFSSAWRTSDVPCSDDCSKDDCPVCTENKKKALQEPNYCGILVVPNGPFHSCHHFIDPTFYFQACLHDLCLTKGDPQVHCRSIQSYATACQDAGVVLEAWRRPSFCFLKCPANSTYSLCTNHCRESCRSLRDASSCPQTCVEGCQCDQGFIFDGSGCVPEDGCGCFVEGKYYKPNEEVLTQNCRLRCKCVPGQGVACESHSCTKDETCEIQDGVLGCVNKNPCKALKCRSKEKCDFTGGQAKCVPSLVAHCWGWGDPHYRTFDGLKFDFQGTCTYTMAESCGNDTTLVPFKVEAKNNIRNGVNSVSYVSLVTVKVYGHQISIHQREMGKVRVDGVSTLLPVTLEEEKLRVTQSGLRAAVDTSFGLRVTYDWNWHVVIDLPSSYYKHVCGLCGNYNLKAEDDVPKGGTEVAAVVAWAGGWRAGDADADDPFCWDHCEGTCPVCEEEKKELYGGNQYCGLIKKSFQGPFQGCHDVVKPQEFYRNCLYDVCMSDGAKRTLCEVLETYAATCKKNGATVRDWRTPAGCPLPCPENSHYDACGTACPATCAHRDAPTSCPHPCVETCACDPGHVLNGGRCVAVGSCGCTHDGRYHPPGEEFWGDESCHARCRCDPELGMVTCQEAGCKVGEKCSLVKGVRKCVATNSTVCVATGDPHYTTFDGRRYDFMGTCVYRLAALCADDPTLVPFAVHVENNQRGSRVVSYTKEVTLEVYNVTLSLSQEHPEKLKVDGVLVDLPFSHSDKLHVYRKGFHGFIETDFDLVVTFDWHSHARVILPNTYAGAVCGLCGDADGDPSDDFTSSNGTLVEDEVQFADSWKVADVPGCSAACTQDCGVCTEAQKRPYRGDKHCGLLVKAQGPLGGCHGVVDPQPYFQDCLFDACVYKGHQETVCRIITAYVADCQAKGGQVKRWRTAAFCSPVCPPNQHYDLCVPPCPPTCHDGANADHCDATTAANAANAATCTEGCACDPGFLRSGTDCVPAARCGCTHGGRYYPVGATFVPCPRCSERCVCAAGGLVRCEVTACGAGEACEVRDGVRGCYPTACGVCQVLGAGSYSTFDRRSLRLAGRCRYLLASGGGGGGDGHGVSDGGGDGDGGGGEAFDVEVEEEAGGKIRRLEVTVHGITVGMEGGEQWEVTVSGERQLLPLVLAGGAVTVTREGTHRVLQARDGLKLLFDGAAYAALTLPVAFRGRTRGLCGDFDGDATNDVTDPQALGDAWGIPTPGCTHGDVPTACPPPPPERCRMLEDPEGPFRGCHRVVAPGEHVASCAQGGCGQGDGDGDGDGDAAACRSLQAYAAACQAAGGTLEEWREEAKCPMSCPPHSHYELCTHSCAHSCASLSSSTPCTPKCFEGCQCDQGLLFNGDRCVHPNACGCLYQGRYFRLADSVLSPDCSRRCLCRAPGALQCRPAGCPFGQSCGLLDGRRGCVDQPGRCSLAPSSRFISFDGATGATTATGVYLVATVCDHHSPNWFRLLGDVGDSRDRPAVEILHLFISKAFVTIKRDKKVWVNGVPAALPVDISGSVTIAETRGTIWVTQDPQLVIGLSPGGEVTVTVTKDLSQKLCGLCGDYDGHAANDLRGPDGKLLGDAVALAKAWRAPDFTHLEVTTGLG